eukprot:5815296-Karenia_brevis.AAC.1
MVKPRRLRTEEREYDVTTYEPYEEAEVVPKMVDGELVRGIYRLAAGSRRVSTMLKISPKQPRKSGPQRMMG